MGLPPSWCAMEIATWGKAKTTEGDKSQGRKAEALYYFHCVLSFSHQEIGKSFAMDLHGVDIEETVEV